MMEMIILLGSLVLSAMTFIAAYLFRPGALLKAYSWSLRRRLGLVDRYSYSGSYRFSYSSRGTPGGATPSLLMLHGFSDSKDVLMPVVKYLPRSQHVVCVDMPGHGGTSRTGPEDYSIQGQVGRIHQCVLSGNHSEVARFGATETTTNPVLTFLATITLAFVQSIGLDKRPFHLVGTSMGGCVAGVYAARYPAHLTSITLICPAGLDYPTKTGFMSHLMGLVKSQQLDSLIPSTLQEIEDQMKLCCYAPIKLPRLVLRGLLDDMNLNSGFYKELVMELTKEESRHSLQENLHLITSPVQVIWGTEDKLVDVSGAAVLQESLPNCQVTLLEKCGHAVASDQPQKATELIMDFLSAQEVSDENTKKLS